MINKVEEKNVKNRVNLDKIVKEIDDIVSSVKAVDDENGFFVYRCKIVRLLEELNENEIIELKQKTNSYITLFEVIFSNEFFNKTLLKILKDDRMYLEKKGAHALTNKANMEEFNLLNLNEKIVINSALHLSSFLLAIFLEKLSHTEVSILRNKFVLALNNILKYQNQDFVLSDICFKFYDIITSPIYYKKVNFPFYIDGNFYYNNNQASKCLLGAMVLISSQHNSLKQKFKNVIRKKEFRQNDQSGLYGSINFSKELNNIYKLTTKIRGGIQWSMLSCSRIYKEKIFEKFVESFSKDNEKNTLYILNLMTSGFHFQEENTFGGVLINKIKAAKDLKLKMNEYAKNNFQAFSGHIDENNLDWSNKIYLITNKTLSTFETINEAKDDNWKIKVVIYELSVWVDEIHQVLNKYDIEDEWYKIEKLLKQEDFLVEWKSTFLTPTQQKFINEKIETENKKRILLIIINAMLGMINTDGGYILVGLIEKPELVEREDIKKNTILKNGVNFFNIDYEFKKNNINLDILKLRIIDLLSAETLLSQEKFNHLFSIEPIEIRNNYNLAIIYKIKVSKAEKLVFTKSKKIENSWVLIKRANGKTIEINPNN